MHVVVVGVFVLFVSIVHVVVGGGLNLELHPYFLLRGELGVGVAVVRVLDCGYHVADVINPWLCLKHGLGGGGKRLLLDPEHDLAIGESSVILLALTLHRY